MIVAKVTDHAGLEHVIHTAADLNQLVARLEERRDALAELMLDPDRGAAMAAERESDRIEDVFLPRFQAEIERVGALLDAGAADEHRYTKARAIKDRPRAALS